jgi:hypothetical protein
MLGTNNSIRMFATNNSIRMLATNNIIKMLTRRLLGFLELLGKGVRRKVRLQREKSQTEEREKSD